MYKREAFVEAACKENVGDFLQFIQLHNDKSDPFDVEEVVQEMPRGQKSDLWGRLVSLLENALLELPPDRWQPSQDEDMQDESAAHLKHVMAVVDGVTLVAAVSLGALQEGDTYSELLKITHRLHSVLVSLPASDVPVLKHIQTLCEAWWKEGLQEKEEFGRTALLLSLQKSLVLKKPGAEIQRVWSLHDVLLSLDYKSEDNKQIVDLLVRCFQCPNYIRNDDGKRFLVFLFSWNIDFIWVIHGTIKNQLRFYSKTMNAHISEIYYRAWKKARGEFLEKIESSCIQDFMQCAIFLHRASPVHAKVRQIVNYYHARKGSHNVDRMLVTLYRPILWKALSVPNFEVRANAALLFTDAFPIHNPEQSNEDMEASVQIQLDAVMGLLEDPHPAVRSTATLGVCKILRKFWELLPPVIITDFLKKLLELAADSSSPDVRCSVFKCLPMVLSNSLSHPLLEKLLPTLKNSLHDNSEKVRAAFLDLLIEVKAVRAAKFWDVCSMEHLLARLANDSPSVSKRVVNLLFKSFFPVNESEKEWCSRCITLIQMNPVAVRKFYQYAHQHTAPTNLIKLMLAIRHILNSCIQVDCDTTEMNDSNKENSLSEPAGLVKDVAMVSSLLEVLVILWKSVQKALQKNEEAQKYMSAKFGNVMARYFQSFEDERATVPLIQLASFMPPAAAPAFSCGVLSRLRKMDSRAVPAQYGQLLDCLCSWGQVADVLELITDWLSLSLPSPRENTAGRKVRIQETVEAKPDVALMYLEYLFSHTLTREKVLALSWIPLTQLHAVLGNWKSVLYAHLSAAADPEGPGEQTALRAFVFCGRLAAHLQFHPPGGRDYLLSMQRVAAWVADGVLPFLVKRSGSDSEGLEEAPSLAAQITESFLTVCRDVVLVGLADDTFKTQILQLCSLILLSETGHRCIPAVLQVLKEVASSCVPEESSQDQERPAAVALGVVADIFQKIMELLARRLKNQPDQGKQLCLSAVPGLTDFLQAAQTWDRALLTGVFSTVLAVIIVENKNVLQKVTRPEEVITPETAEDMPPLSSTLLSVIFKSASATRSFLAEVCSSLESEVISGVTELAAVLNVLAVVKHSAQWKCGLKSAAVLVQQQIDRHAAAGSSDIHRLIYESSVTTLNQILHL